MISENVLKKYPMFEMIDKTKEGQIFYYQTFLSQTDYVSNKIIEAKVLGKETEDYTEVLEARQFARDEINRLEAENK